MKTFFVLVFCFIPFLSIAQNTDWIEEPGPELEKVNSFTKVPPPSIFVYRSELQKVQSVTFRIDYSTNFPAGDARNAWNK